MAKVKHISVPGAMEVTRRRLLAAGGIVGTMIAAPVVAKAFQTPVATVPDGMPFLKPLADDPETVALCFPASRITHAHCYMLADGRTIYGEHGRCNDGSGWRDCALGEWDGLIVGRVVTLLTRGEKGWVEVGRAALAG